MGFAGTQNGRFYKIVPDYVDQKKDPGTSELAPTTFTQWVKQQPFVILYTPNTVWALISLAMYFVFPYDLSAKSVAASAPLSLAFFAQRWPLWFAVTYGYTAWWHVTLYFAKWAGRPFIKDRPYSLDKVLHNMFWSFLGIAQWVAFENVFCFLWASGRLPYLSDASAFSGNLRLLGIFLAGIPLVATWRDFHFYFAHRLLHFKGMYAQVHSLHHRNTDVEPFAGLSMHPVEHLYYYACVLPSLVFLCSPHALLWNGVHLLLAPAASHSGWEDHFQADVYHYFHHRYFSVNFAGANASFLDSMFGSFQGKPSSGDKEGMKPRHDAKSTLRAPPSAEFLLYLGLSGACLVAWAAAALRVAAGTLALTSQQAMILSAVAGFGPALLAEVVTAFFRSSGGAPNFGILGWLLQQAVGHAFCSVPIAYMAYLCLTPAAAA